MRGSASLERHHHVRAVEPPASTPVDNVVLFSDRNAEAANAMEARILEKEGGDRQDRLGSMDTMVEYVAPTAAVPTLSLPVYETVAEEPAYEEPVTNQWTAKHIYEDHAHFWNREWNEHHRNVFQSQPIWMERQEQEARLVASKNRERTNATAADHGYHYRGEQGEPDTSFGYPFHHTPIPRPVSDYMSVYDQRYGNPRMMDQARTMPCTFLKHKNPRFHIHQGLPRTGSSCHSAMGSAENGIYPAQSTKSYATGLKQTGTASSQAFVISRNPSGYERAASAAYGVYRS